jgi:hypothetical protein
VIVGVVDVAEVFVWPVVLPVVPMPVPVVEVPVVVEVVPGVEVDEVSPEVRFVFVEAGRGTCTDLMIIVAMPGPWITTSYV